MAIPALASDNNTEQLNSFFSDRSFSNTETHRFLSSLNKDNFRLELESGSPVSSSVEADFLTAIENKDFSIASEIVALNNLSVIREVFSEDTSRDVEQTLDYERMTNHLLYATDGSGYTLQGFVYLRGTIRYNTDGTLTPIGNPRVSMDFWNGTWSVFYDNVTTSSYQIENNRAVQASASFSVRGEFTTDIINVG